MGESRINSFECSGFSTTVCYVVQWYMHHGMILCSHTKIRKKYEICMPVRNIFISLYLCWIHMQSKEKTVVLHMGAAGRMNFKPLLIQG
jgi:hypothetical protein